MRSLLILWLFLASFASVSAQFRLDAGVRLGRSNVKYLIGPSGGAFDVRHFEGLFSAGVDARAGFELPLGFGVASGLSYDLVRTDGVMPVMTNVMTGVQDPSRSWVHTFHFLTIPLLAEYRFWNDVVRPYGGIGAAFLIGRPDNHLDRAYGRTSARFDYHTVTPTLLFGLNLEFRRLMVGVAVRRDLAPFWEERRYYDMTWKARQVAARLGWRIF